jgi:hypothetical protein
MGRWIFLAVVALACAASIAAAARATPRSPTAVPTLVTGTYTGKVNSFDSANPRAPWATVTVTIRRTGSSDYAAGVLSLRGLQKSFSCSLRFSAHNLYGSDWLPALPARNAPCAVNEAAGVQARLTVIDSRHLKAELGLMFGTLTRKT